MGSINLIVTAVDESDRSVLEEAVRNRTREVLRTRIKSQAGVLGSFLGSATNGGALRRLDRNRDGLLQADELPERFRDRAMEFFDRDANAEIDEEEMNKARQELKPVLER
jgi:hypothetical protein